MVDGSDLNNLNDNKINQNDANHAIELDKVYNSDSLLGMKDIPNEFIDCIITDPPYGVNYNKKSEQLSRLSRIGKANKKQIVRDKPFNDTHNLSPQIERDKTFIEAFNTRAVQVERDKAFIEDKDPDKEKYDAFSKEWYRILKPNTHIYIFCGDNQLPKWIMSMKNAGFKNYQVLIWLKNHSTFDMSFGHRWLDNKENILFFHKGWKKLNGFKVERLKFRTVLLYDSSKDTAYHSCAKPVDLLMLLIKASSDEGGIILDCFAGGGNHLIAAKLLKRHYIGYEISPTYCKTIEARINDLNMMQTLDHFISSKTEDMEEKFVDIPFNFFMEGTELEDEDHKKINIIDEVNDGS
jgi:DNA modification methylase